MLLIYFWFLNISQHKAVHNASAHPQERASESNKNHSLAINIHTFYIPQYILPHHMLTKYAYISDGYMDIYGKMVHPRGFEPLAT